MPLKEFVQQLGRGDRLKVQVITISSGSSGHRVTVPEPLSSTLFLIKRILREALLERVRVGWFLINFVCDG